MDMDRPKCNKCFDRLADKLPKREGVEQGYRKTCSLCRRSPPTPEQVEAARKARQEQAAKVVSHVRPLCKKCGVNVCRIQYNKDLKLRAGGLPYYQSECNSCHRGERTVGEQYPSYRRNALKAAGDNPKCSYCGFEPLHVCQLDVDHIDGDKKNNDLANLQILCSNCHRLKTWANGDDRKWNEEVRKQKRPWGHWAQEETDIITPGREPWS